MSHCRRGVPSRSAQATGSIGPSRCTPSGRSSSQNWSGSGPSPTAVFVPTLGLASPRKAHPPLGATGPAKSDATAGLADPSGCFRPSPAPSKGLASAPLPSIVTGTSLPWPFTQTSPRLPS